MRLVLLALFLCVASCDRVDRETNVAGARVQIATFKTALEAFHEDAGRFPSTAEGLSALVVKPVSLSDKQ